MIGAVLAFFTHAKAVSPHLASSLVKEVRDFDGNVILSIRDREKLELAMNKRTKVEFFRHF